MTSATGPEAEAAPPQEPVRASRSILAAFGLLFVGVLLAALSWSAGPGEARTLYVVAMVWNFGAALISFAWGLRNLARRQTFSGALSFAAGLGDALLFVLLVWGRA